VVGRRRRTLVLYRRTTTKGIIIMRMRRLAVSLLATGLLAGVAGCSDSSTDNGTDNSTAVLPQESFAEDVIAAQTESGSAHIEATINVSGSSFDMSGDVTALGEPDALKMDVTASAGGEQMRLVLVERVLYVKGEQFAPEGKEWLKIDLSDPSNPLSQVFDAANPSNFTAYLQGITKFEDVGVETVDGVETRHYTVTVDTAEMLESNPVFRGQDAATLGLPAELTSEVYVDSENRPVQIEADLGDTGTFEVHFSDYGKNVSVKAPDPSTVGEFSL
jgi:hypothetical protein